MLAAQHPQSGLPFGAAQSGDALDGKHEARGGIETALENLAQPLAFLSVAQLVVHRVDIDRQLALLLQIVNGIFESWIHIVRIKPQPPG